VPSNYKYGTFANYSPRGTSEPSKRSRGTCGAIKAGRINIIESAITHLRDPKSDVLKPFLDSNVTLVPAPRSAPLPEGALWPSRVICDVLHRHSFGADVRPLLTRTTAIPRSSHSPAAERPLVHDHMASIAVDRTMFAPDAITLVDDVLTMGRTTFACAERLHKAYPSAAIRIFALIRTQGIQEEIKAIVDPSIGTIIGYPSGKTHRDP